MRTLFLITILDFLLAGMLLGCGKRLPPLPAELTEVQRIPSESGKVDVVVLSSDAGATTSVGTHLFLVPHGYKVKTLKYAVLSMDHVGGLVINWNSEKELTLSFSKARIFHYTNFWQHQDVDDFKHIIEITLFPNSSNSLPRNEIEVGE